VRKQGLRSITITGKTPAKSRQALVDQFQSDPECRVAILSLTAAGVGLNLHAARHVVITEMLFGPDVLLQAEDRSHRLGQVRDVLVQYLTASDTLDELVWRLVQRKQATAGQLMVNKAGHFAADSTQHVHEIVLATPLQPAQPSAQQLAEQLARQSMAIAPSAGEEEAAELSGLILEAAPAMEAPETEE